MKAYIGLGANLGDGKRTLQDAYYCLGDIEGIQLDSLSSPYLSAPVDMKSGHWFTNAVGRLDVSLEPLELLRELLLVEDMFGRSRGTSGFGYQDRTLDLDLLYFGTVILDSPELTLPHPRIAGRLFVLLPLLELEADFVDHVSNKEIAELEGDLQKKIGKATRKEQEIVRSSWND